MRDTAREGALPTRRKQGAFDTRLRLGAALGCLLTSSPAWAQPQAGEEQSGEPSTESAAQSEDVIFVTAQRRSEALLSTPLSVSAINGDDLLRQGVLQPLGLASVIPNLQVNDSTGGSEPNFTLRGVGLGNDYSSNQASPVGVYVDDAYLAFRATHGSQLFDLERVEVLRGPQGTLFGRNTTGGAINFITRRPQLDAARGFVDAGYGNFNDWRVEAAGEAPLVQDILGVRAAISYNRHDGYIENLFPGGRDLQSADLLRARLSARFRPSESLDINLRLFTSHGSQIQPGVVQLGLAPGGVNPFTGYSRAGLDFFQVSSDNPHRNSTDIAGVALTLNYALSDALSIQSLTAYDRAESLFGQDVDGSPIALLETVFRSDYEEFSQELRLIYESERLSMQGGVYFGRDEVDIDNDFSLFPFLEDLGIPADPFLVAGGATITQGYTQIRESWAVFGQMDLEIVPRLTLTIGARYTEDKARYENGTAFIGDYDFTPLVQTVGAPGAPLEREGENEAVTGRVALSYEFESGTLVYASYNRGYRAGTFNGSGYLDPSQITFVEPETVDAYELGLKGRLFDRRLRFALALFHYDYADQQIQDVVGPVAFLLNAGASTLQGVELEATARFSPNASLSLSAGYTDSEYNELTLQGLDLSGNELPFTPDLTASARFEFTIANVFGGDITLAPSVTYTGQQFFTPYNDIGTYASVQQEAYAVVDAVAEWTNGTWTFRLWGKNLADEGYYTYGNSFPAFGFNYFNVNQPRTFGVAARRVF